MRVHKRHPNIVFAIGSYFFLCYLEINNKEGYLIALEDSVQ